MRRLSWRILLGIPLVVFVSASLVAHAWAQATTAPQSTDDILRHARAVEAENAALAKENAALRERIKLEEENAKLHDRMRRLVDSKPGAATQQDSSSASAPAVSSPDPKIALYDDASLPMATKAPPPPPAPVYSWTGWYVGGNFGAGWGTANNNISFTQTSSVNTPASFSAQDSVKFNGPIGGIQAGYNWQVSNFLLGFEADIQGSPQTGTSTTLNGIIFSVNAPNPATGTDNEKLDWFGTVRGRLGLTSDRWLVYGTGGLAYGKVDLSGNVQPASPAALGVANAPIGWGNSTVKAGWVAGGGIENELDAHWSWKVEYLFMDLAVGASLSGGIGIVTGIGPGNCYGNAGACNFYSNSASGRITSSFTDNIVRVGLNYQFH